MHLFLSKPKPLEEFLRWVWPLADEPKVRFLKAPVDPNARGGEIQPDGRRGFDLKIKLDDLIARDRGKRAIGELDKAPIRHHRLHRLSEEREPLRFRF